ncbi:MAG: hypothetical protein K0R90_1469 [Oscillospiraceae bacterium]|nr:hypothetical protein [Oscillospiraceae bacterium]
MDIRQSQRKLMTQSYESKVILTITMIVRLHCFGKNNAAFRFIVKNYVQYTYDQTLKIFYNQRLF